MNCGRNRVVSSACWLTCRVTLSLIGNCQPYGSIQGRRGLVEVLGVLSELAGEQEQAPLLV